MVSIVTYFLRYRFPPKSSAVCYYLAGTSSFPTSCPSLVYIADMHGVYKSKYPLLIKKTSFEVEHCKIEIVVLSRSAQADLDRSALRWLKKTYS